MEVKNIPLFNRQTKCGWVLTLAYFILLYSYLVLQAFADRFHLRLYLQKNVQEGGTDWGGGKLTI